MIEFQTVTASRESSGFTMVEVLAATAIVSIVSLSVLTSINNTKKSLASLEIRSDLAQISNSLQNEVSCKHTLRPVKSPNSGVVCNGSIVLKNHNDAIFPIQTPQYRLTSLCTNAGLTLSIRLTNTSGTTRKHPETGQLLDENNSTINPLVGRGSSTSLCAADFLQSGRVKAYQVPLGTLGLSAADCAAISASYVFPAQGLSNPAVWAQYKAPYQLYTNMRNRCHAWCLTPPNTAKGGLLADCTNTNAECTCFR